MKEGMLWSNEARAPQLLSLRSRARAPQLLSLRSRARAPQLLSLYAATTEACAPKACAPQQEKPPQWEAHTPQWRVVPAHRN